MATPQECAMKTAPRISLFVVLACLSHVGLAAEPQSFDVLIRGGTVYDGSGQAGVKADIGIRGDTIATIGDLADARAKTIIDASGKAVAPGFINVLSWATEALLHDGRSQSDVRQGVTLEIFGEGWSMGPLSEAMKRRLKADQGELKYDVAWTTLAEYLQHLEHKGVSCNVASFVGATTARIHVIGYEDRKPSKQELAKMKALVRAEMENGALGVGSSLIYAPAFYADTQELIELARVAAEYEGVYISHIRSEGNRLEEAVDEFLKIVREAKVAGEVYHLKAAGEANGPELTGCA
jgi:N-acyl-D-amino-acid deacylase